MSKNKTEKQNLFRIVGPALQNSETLSRKHYSYWKSVGKTLLRSKVFIICLLLLFLIVAFAIFNSIGKDAIPLLPTQRPGTGPANPGWTETQNGDTKFFILGLGINGEDYWTEIWIGTKWTFIFAICVASLQILLGLIVGLIWGYFRKLDILFISLINIINIVPTLIMILVMISIMGVGFWPLVVGVIIQSWIGLASTARMQTLFVLNNDYNVASRMLGTPTPKIIVSNILPKILPVIIQSAAFAIPTAISIDATFSYLGYGFVDAEGHITSLGTIISQVMARTDFYVYPMLIIAPLFMISLIAFLFFFVSKILADSLDAKLHRR